MSIRQAYTKYPEDNYAMENVEAENLVFSLFYRKLGNKYAVVMSDTQAIDSTGIIGGFNLKYSRLPSEYLSTEIFTS